MLEALVAAGRSPPRRRLWPRVPVAEDITVESDSGGHTDNRPLAALFPTILALRDRSRPSTATPARSASARPAASAPPARSPQAFALGASYVLTGSINQACVESGLSENGRAMLSQADLADVMMAPAADMFEMGVKVQVLQARHHVRVAGQEAATTSTATYDSLEALPAERTRAARARHPHALSSRRGPTPGLLLARDPQQVERAERDAKHRMALVFRCLPRPGQPLGDRRRRGPRLDYQIWCGPAMGAFNAWVTGHVPRAPENRSRRPDSAQPDRGRRRDHARPAAPHVRECPCPQPPSTSALDR
jgi:trans-AT polyketide synthase, acyltransferase and oxidoreductase domains